MGQVERVVLPAPAAAAAGAAVVWCAAGGRLLAFEAGGASLLDLAAPTGLRSLAAADGVLAAALATGAVLWLDPGNGGVLERASLGGEPELVAGGGAIWALDRGSARAWRLAAPGVLSGPVFVPGCERLAPWGTRIWWTSREDSLLRGGERPVDLGVGPGGRGGMVVCGGSVWLSVSGGLLRVGAWAGEPGPPLAAPAGPVEHLACADGILLGGSGPRGLLALDPSVDADARLLDAELGGELGFLVATRSRAWAFPAGRAEARIVPVRPGE
jgi:hypothetical protein